MVPDRSGGAPYPMTEYSFSREDRTRAVTRARLWSARGEREALVVGASTRRLRVLAAETPARGEIVDVQIGRQSLVGRVRWRFGRHCGISLAEPICVVALLEGGEVPIALSPAAAAIVEQRPLASAMASDGPWQARLLQMAAIVALILGGFTVASRLGSLSAETQDGAAFEVVNELASGAVSGAGQLSGEIHELGH